jgi:hypothetical protein
MEIKRIFPRRFNVIDGEIEAGFPFSAQWF